MIRTTVFIAAVLCSAAVVAAQKTINVTTYGAIAGDGKDDSAAIKSAISAAAPGDTIAFPAGVFDIVSTINAKSSISISGAGLASTTVRFIGTSSTSLLTLDHVSNVQISGLTLDGNNSTKAAQGIWSQNSSKLNLHDLKVQNLGATSGFAPHGIYFSAAVVDSTISNSFFSNIGTGSQWGAGIRVAQGSSRNQVLGNTVTNVGRGGVLCDDNSTDLIIRHNTVTGSGKSSLADSIGIELWGGCDRAIVEDNNIDHWLSVDSSNNVAVRRNTISDKTGEFGWAGLELVDAHDDIFTDNTVDDGAHVGISVSGPAAKERIYWGHNTIKTPSSWGVQLQGEAGTARNMYFYKNTFSGAKKNSPATLSPPQGHGVRFNGDDNHIVFDSNTITANEGAGIQITGSSVLSLRFIKNVISSNAGPAVTSSGSVANTQWSGNTVNGNGTDNALSDTSGATVYPTASITGMTARAGDELTFNFTSTGGAAANVLWDFGDGLPSTELSPKHTYAAPGTYRVTLITWNAAGDGALSEMNLNVAGSVPEPVGILPAALLTASVGLMLRRRAHRAIP